MKVPTSILIAGGGTAGWMTANLLQFAWPDCTITLVESKEIGTIGVGEGSTPYLKEFFKKLNIADAEWMPFCHATYKSGISFPAWSTAPGYESYFHPFFSQLDLEPATPFFDNAQAQRSGANQYAHPDFHFVSTQIAHQCRAPVPHKSLPYEIDYGYHFDAALLGKFLCKRATSRGLTRIEDEIVDITMDEQGISSIVTKGHGPINAEYYVDCTGFSSLLLIKGLDVPFISFNSNLINNAAVAISTDIGSDSPIPSNTTSEALSNGWVWKIPLTTRYGNGYVYSDAHISSDQAETELRKKLNISLDADIPVKHIKMKVGRVEKHWHKNCLAVGLSQGFIEPLEATALMLMQYTVEAFIQAHEGDDANAKLEEKTRTRFNHQINSVVEGVRDYIVTHYKLNTRSDTEYWCQAREDIPVSDNLAALLNSWQKANDEFEETLDALQDSLIYQRVSWYVILSGMGFFPRSTLRDPSPEIIARHGRIKAQCLSIAADLFPDHRSFLGEM